MWPELGKYAATVINAYIVTIVLTGLLTWLSLRSARKSKRELEELEARRNG